MSYLSLRHRQNYNAALWDYRYVDRPPVYQEEDLTIQRVYDEEGKLWPLDIR